MKKRTQGCLLLLSAALIWGATFVAQSTGMEDVGPFTFNAARFLIGALVLVPFAAASRGKNEMGCRHAGTYFNQMACGLLCGTLLFITSALQQFGLLHTAVGKAGFITSLYIVLVPILGLFIGRRSEWFVWCGVALAGIGMYLLCVNNGFALETGDILVFLSACSTAVHMLIVDCYVRDIDGVVLSCTQFAICGAISLFMALILENISIRSLLNAGLPILYAGVLGSGAAYTFQILGQRYVQPADAALICSLESVFAVLFGWLLLHESLSTREIVGCILIFTAITIAQMPQMRRKKTEA